MFVSLDTARPIVDNFLTTPVAVLAAFVVTMLVGMDLTEGVFEGFVEMINLGVLTKDSVTVSCSMSGFLPAMIAKMFQLVDDMVETILCTDVEVHLGNCKSIKKSI